MVENHLNSAGRQYFTGGICLLCSLLSICYVFSSAFAGQKNTPISRFSEKSLSEWKERPFEGKTHYSFVKDNEKGWVIKAESTDSASGLLRQLEVDLNETPYLNWSWKVERLPDVRDEKTREGDDYPVRLYVIFKIGYWFWDTMALNYVWNSNYPVGASWPNAFTENSRVLVLQSGRACVGEWVTEKRNVPKDIMSYFGIQVDSIEGIAIMTDTDNSGDRAIAYYGDIFFTSQ